MKLKKNIFNRPDWHRFGVGGDCRCAAGIDRIIDMGRTVMSITGDASCAIVMRRIMGNKLVKVDLIRNIIE